MPRAGKRQIKRVWQAMGEHPTAHEPPALRVQYRNIHLFEAPLRRVESRSAGPAAVFLVMLGGRYAAEWDGGDPVSAGPGEVVFWPARQLRAESNEPPERMKCLTVYCRWDDPLPGLPRVVRDRLRLIGSLAQTLLVAKATVSPRRDMLRDAFVSAIAAEFIRLAGKTDEQLVAKVAHYTEQHLRKPFGLEDLCRHVQLGKRYFGRRYKQLTGCTPMQDVRRIRIEHAIGILRSAPDIPLKEVAYRVGMANGHLLSRWLRRELNVTSRQVRATGTTTG